MMKISIDTNVLARAILQDEAAQAKAADRVLREAPWIAITLPCLCELVWILRDRLSRSDVAATIRDLLQTSSIVMDRPAAEAGLDVLEAGGDFADGVLAYEGQRLGGETFLSFDRQAVFLLTKLGKRAKLLS